VFARLAADRRAVLVMLSVLAVHLGVLLWLDRVPGPRPLWGDEIMYWDVASRWAAGQPATLEPLWPPLYPRMVAFVLSHGGSALAVQAVQATLLACALWLLTSLLRGLVGAPIALGTSLLLAIDPQVVAFAFYFWPEMLHLALVCAGLWVAVTRPRIWPMAALLGVIAGLTLLTKNLLGPFLPIAAGLWIVSDGRTALAAVGVATLAMAITVSPVALDNVHRHGTLLPGDSARFNVWVGLNDVSRRNLVDEIVGDELATFLASGSRQADRNRVLDARIRTLVSERGMWTILRSQLGRQYIRLFDKDSFFTDQLPGSGIEAPDFGYRALSMAGAWAPRLWAYTVYLLILILAPFGFIRLWRRHRALAVGIAAYVGCTLAICLLVHVKTRYRVALMPALAVCASAALLHARAPGSRIPPALLGLAATASLVLVGLALANTLDS
jgi:hypothetical protein